MHFVCWIPKATNTLCEYVILIACPLQQVLHEHLSMLSYVYIACIFNIVAMAVIQEVKIGMRKTKFQQTQWLLSENVDIMRVN
jgi:hypothetical protein